jgi:hypothetical protein
MVPATPTRGDDGSSRSPEAGCGQHRASLLTMFLLRPSLAGMTWANDEELRLSIRMGIREGFDLVRGTRGSLSEDQERVIADAVVKHFEKGNWRIERGPPSEGRVGR